jgi:hypothetical protein
VADALDELADLEEALDGAFTGGRGDLRDSRSPS